MWRAWPPRSTSVNTAAACTVRRPIWIITRRCGKREEQCCSACIILSSEIEQRDERNAAYETQQTTAEQEPPIVCIAVYQNSNCARILSAGSMVCWAGFVNYNSWWPLPVSETVLLYWWTMPLIRNTQVCPLSWRSKTMPAPETTGNYPFWGMLLSVQPDIPYLARALGVIPMRFNRLTFTRMPSTSIVHFR
jgi:hypothetical protein